MRLIRKMILNISQRRGDLILHGQHFSGRVFTGLSNAFWRLKNIGQAQNTEKIVGVTLPLYHVSGRSTGDLV